MLSLLKPHSSEPSGLAAPGTAGAAAVMKQNGPKPVKGAEGTVKLIPEEGEASWAHKHKRRPTPACLGTLHASSGIIRRGHSPLGGDAFHGGPVSTEKTVEELRVSREEVWRNAHKGGAEGAEPAGGRAGAWQDLWHGHNLSLPEGFYPAVSGRWLALRVQSCRSRCSSTTTPGQPTATAQATGS